MAKVLPHLGCSVTTEYNMLLCIWAGHRVPRAWHLFSFYLIEDQMLG